MLLLLALACNPDVTDTGTGCKDPVSWFVDADGDGFGDPEQEASACEAPAGTVEDATDCDDALATVFPGAAETCDQQDNDCNGLVDDEAPDAAVWYLDEDGDGAAGDSEVVACEAPAGAYATSTDCDDADPAIFPGAAEVCDGVDNNCDGDADLDATDALDWYEDLDGDGAYGTFVVHDCEGDDELRPVNDDCDDADPLTYRGAPEDCAEVDRDCNGDPDADAVDTVAWYEDGDHDGAGGALDQYACTQPAGDVATADDCDDTDPAVHPAATEVCNTFDDDCDGLVDDADEVPVATTWFVDLDGDGYAGVETVARCTAAPDGYAVADDCDDTDPAVSPDAIEVCGGVDEDCDGLLDDEDPVVTGTHDVYADADGDGYGVDSAASQACVAPAGWGETTGDCDDADPAVSPAASEICSGIDEDCDGLVDDADDSLDPALTTGWYSDLDGDGFGAALESTSCAGAEGLIAIGGDCDDADPAVSPGLPEVCGGGDEDCDGLVDDAGVVTDGTWYYRDRDGDTVGADDEGWAWCADPGEGYVKLGGDCDDTDASVSSGCVEPVFTEAYDVVVVGSGPAGTSAALTALEMGASVLLIERAEQAGEGLLAGQGLFAAGTRYQSAEAIPDSTEDAIADWEDITGEPGDQESVRTYIEATDEILAWIESYGVPIASIDERDDTGPVARSHIIEASDKTTGRPLMVEAYAGDLWTQVEVTGPVMWAGELVGVRTHDLVTGTTGMVGAKAVILATGGFQRDADLVESVLPGMSSRDYVYECIPDADGGGVPFTDLVGAAYFNRENIGIYSHSVHDPFGGEHDGLTWYGAGQGIVVGEDGQRFAAENTLSSLAFWRAAPEGAIFSIADADIVASASFSRPFYNWTTGSSESLSFDELYAASDEVYYGASIAELAAAAGIDAATLQTSIEDFNRSLVTGIDPFGRELGHTEPLEDPDWYAFRMYFGVAKAFGGVQTDVTTRVLDEDGVAIPGFYAAGEVAGMLPGGGGGVGWGGSVSACYYGGRVAGEEAAIYAAAR